MGNLNALASRYEDKESNNGRVTQNDQTQPVTAPTHPE